MELKKNKKYDLERKRPLFFGIGLIMTLSFVISAFEWRTAIDPICVLCDFEDDEDWVYTEISPITEQKKMEPPKPKIEVKPPIQTIEAKDDLKETIEELEIDIDIETSDEIIDVFNGVSFSEETADDPFIVSEVMPSYPGGEKALVEFIVRNTKFTKSALNMRLEGKVSVQFIIEKDGSVQEAHVLNPIGFGLDEEAIRVVKLLRFSPGKQRGIPVRVQMTVPIKFQLR